MIGRRSLPVWHSWRPKFVVQSVQCCMSDPKSPMLVSSFVQVVMDPMAPNSPSMGLHGTCRKFELHSERSHCFFTRPAAWGQERKAAAAWKWKHRPRHELTEAAAERQMTALKHVIECGNPNDMDGWIGFVDGRRALFSKADSEWCPGPCDGLGRLSTADFGRLVWYDNLYIDLNSPRPRFYPKNPTSSTALLDLPEPRVVSPPELGTLLDTWQDDWSAAFKLPLYYKNKQKQPETTATATPTRESTYSQRPCLQLKTKSWNHLNLRTTSDPGNLTSESDVRPTG